MSETTDMVVGLKEAGQDFEWYPTTTQMIRAVADKIRTLFEDGTTFSILDIGAGDGRVLTEIERMTAHPPYDGAEPASVVKAKYAIEKSPLLLSALPEGVTVVGTDFTEQTLIDKKVDVVFCNPPYSEYSVWMGRIIREANSPHLFFVVPVRWENDVLATTALLRRKAKAVRLLTCDFNNAERKARARVDVLHVDLRKQERTDWRDEGQCGVDPFDLWFSEHFADVSKAPPKGVFGAWERKAEEKERIAGMVKGRNQIEGLSECYRADLDRLIANYKAVCALDADLLKELGVSVGEVKDALKLKISGLKSLYWDELFGRLSAITDRLTASSRSAMLERLQAHTSVDFTVSNAYAVVMWALKNANLYFDRQLVEVYKEMTKEENAVNYKSNTHMTKDTWRYCNGFRSKEERASRLHHYALDYRIVLHTHGAIVTDDFWRHVSRCGLSDTARTYIQDIMTVAKNLGFSTECDIADRQWVSNGLQDFYHTKADGRRELFCSVRAFKNGNIHMKFNQAFMRAFNVEAGRLLGWIKTPQDAQAEVPGVTAEEAEAAWATNLRLASLPMLAAVNSNERDEYRKKDAEDDELLGVADTTRPASADDGYTVSEDMFL